MEDQAYGEKESQKIPIEQLLAKVTEDEILELSIDKARLFRLIETGETNMQSITAGETEFTFQVPVEEPLFQAEYAVSFASLKDETDKGHWRGKLTKELQKAAKKEIEERDYDEGEKITCLNCRGACSFNVTCMCTEGGLVYNDYKTGESDSLREKGEPDKECGSCHGSGRYDASCPICKGHGSSYLYPELTLINETTGVSKTVVLNATRLIAEGILPVLGTNNAYVIKLTSLQLAIAEELGMDRKRVKGTADNYGLYEIDDPRSDIYIYRAHIDPKDSGQDALKLIQEQIVRKYTHDFSAEYDENGVVRGKIIRLIQSKPLNESLRQLIQLAGVHGYRVGYCRRFLETGSTGPAIILLDQNGTPLEQLSSDYSLSVAVQEALMLLSQHS